MATITTLGGSGSGDFTVTAGAVTVSTAIMTTPQAGGSPDGANMIFFVRIEVLPDPHIEVAMENPEGQTSDEYPGKVNVNTSTRQFGGVQNRKVGPNTAIYLQARNRGATNKKVYYTYEWVGIKVA